MKISGKKTFLIGLFIIISSCAGIWAENKTIALDSDHVKKIGRTYEHSNGLVLAYSASGIEFNVKSKYLGVTIAGDSGASGHETDSSARIVAFVNGERFLDKLISKKSETFTIFDVNENGIVTPGKEREFKIEFVGDSITCGYGVDDPVKEHHFKTSTEDATKTYAFKTAQALNADWSFVSVSGWGIISGYTGDAKKNANSVIPRVYDKLGFSWGNTIFGINPGNISWNFDSYQPDFVVINLGTNDATYTKKKADRLQEYVDSYTDFLKQIRRKNPKAYIICCLGMMGDDLYISMSQAVSKYSSETGDSKISALRLKPQQMSDSICADWHPSEKTHEKASKQLIDVITKERINY